jgi:soluble lytic murein transglycosylase
MSHAATHARFAEPPRRRSATVIALVAALVLGALAFSLLSGGVHRNLLPLADVPIIRHEAAAKHLDPALIAAVIYAESKFEPRPSSAGAQGLMQILPETAYYLARLSGGRSFKASDLSRPDVNVAYGSYYLRYLLDRYGGDEMLAVAAYNGGLSNVDRWVARARSAGRSLSVQEIPFPETRAYVERVLAAQREYRQTYPRELGVQ